MVAHWNHSKQVVSANFLSLKSGLMRCVENLLRFRLTISDVLSL